MDERKTTLRWIFDDIELREYAIWISYLNNALEGLVTFLICSSFLEVFTDAHVFPEENFSVFFQPIKHLNWSLASDPAPRLTACHWPAWHPPGRVWARAAGGAWSSWRATWTRAAGGGRGSRGWRRGRGWRPPGNQQLGPQTLAEVSAPVMKKSQWWNYKNDNKARGDGNKV